MNNGQQKKLPTSTFVGIALMLLAGIVLISLQYYAHTTTYATVDAIQASGVITDAQRNAISLANNLKAISGAAFVIIFTAGLIVLVRARGNTSQG